MSLNQTAIIETIYRENYRFLMLRAIKHGLSPGDAEDLIMDVFQGTIKNWAGIEKKNRAGD